MEKLLEVGIEPSNYINWYSLRKWDKITRRPNSNDDANIPTKSPFDDSEIIKSDASKDDVSMDDRSGGETMTDTDDRSDYVSEQLYLHDKLMIVDDRLVLMGSGRLC